MGHPSNWKESTRVIEFMIEDNFPGVVKAGMLEKEVHVQRQIITFNQSDFSGQEIEILIVGQVKLLELLF